ncbi:MAG: HAD family hydrolase [Breznakia sp.]
MDTILFDLDGTLLPMDITAFKKKYFDLLIKFFTCKNYNANIVLKGVMAGSAQMIKNNGKNTNEEVFWRTFESVSGYKGEEIKPLFLEFYEHDFQMVENTCSSNPIVVKAISILRDKGYRIICATNPIFPKVASVSRLRWSGVDVDAFEEITTFENYHYCKPNSKYFSEVMERFKLNPDTCLMVGNDAQEDMAIKALGIPVYLISDHLICREQDEIKEADYVSDANEFLKFVQSLPCI